MAVLFTGDEILWRLIQNNWWLPDPITGIKTIDEAAFQDSKGPSVVRPALLGKDPISFVKSKFPKHGIAQLNSKDIPSIGTANGNDGCLLKFEDDLRFGLQMRIC